MYFKYIKNKMISCFWLRYRVKDDKLWLLWRF